MKYKKPELLYLKDPKYDFCQDGNLNTGGSVPGSHCFNGGTPTLSGFLAACFGHGNTDSTGSYASCSDGQTVFSNNGCAACGSAVAASS
jgi:hypothetical protein